MQQDRLLLVLEKLEGLDQISQIVAVERAVVSKAELFKQHARPKHSFGGMFSFTDGPAHFLATVFFDNLRCALAKMGVHLVGSNFVEVIGNCTYVLVDRPLVIIEHHNQPFGGMGNIVQCLKRNAVSKRGIAGKDNHMLISSSQIAGNGNSEGCRKPGTGVACAVAIMLAFGTQHKAVQSTRLADGVEPFAAAREQLVDISLMAYIEDKMVFWSIEDVMHVLPKRTELVEDAAPPEARGLRHPPRQQHPPVPRKSRQLGVPHVGQAALSVDEP